MDDPTPTTRRFRTSPVVALAACHALGCGGGTGGGDVIDASAGDADPGDADAGGDPPGPWTWCPEGPRDTGDPSWPLRLEVTEQATYCGLADEGFVHWQTHAIQWQEQRDHRAQMWVAPGSYRLPDVDQSGARTASTPERGMASEPRRSSSKSSSAATEPLVSIVGRRRQARLYSRQVPAATGAPRSSAPVHAG